MKISELQQLQPTLIDRFKPIVQGEQLSHAYLFVGQLGSVGMALWLSQSLFCQEKEAGLPCQICRTCRLIEQGEFSDVRMLSPQGNVIKTEVIRDLVQGFSQSGFESNRQVFIICGAEKMHPNAANSLLKVMEEPQSETYLFLLSATEEGVLPTLRSRSQLVTFPANPSYLATRLEEEGVLKSQARLLSNLVADFEEARALAQDASFTKLIQQSQQLVNEWMRASKKAYLLVPGIVALVPEKKEQERLLDLLTVQLAQAIEDKRAGCLLEDMVQVRSMWRSNVSLQQTLEYLTLRHLSE